MTRMRLFEKSTPDTIKTGDMIAWDYYPYSGFSNRLIKTIASMTKAPFGHVGVAWRLQNELFVVEATIPRIQVMWLGGHKNYCYLPMNIDPPPVAIEFLKSKVGLEYSLMDAARSYLGKVVEDDDRYQCAEFTSEFYQTAGLELDTDGSLNALIESCLQHNGRKIFRVV